MMTASSMLWVTISIALVGKSFPLHSQQLGPQVLRGEHVESARTARPSAGRRARPPGPGRTPPVGAFRPTAPSGTPTRSRRARSVDGPFCALVRRLPWLAPLGLESDLDVLAHREPGQQGEALEHHGHARVGSVQGLAPVADLPVVGAIRPAMQRSRVSCPTPTCPRRARSPPPAGPGVTSSSTGSGLPSGEMKSW